MQIINRITLVLSALLFMPLASQAQVAALPQPAAQSQLRVKHQLRVAQPSQLDGEIQDIDRTAARFDAEQTVDKVTQNFRTFIVEPKDIKALLLGMQAGERINLTSPATGKKITVVRYTRAMSLGNAYVALSLAKMDLAQYEIIQPTYEQLTKAINGGTFVQSRLSGTRKIRMHGVLKQYARSRNWDQVAQRIGLGLDPLRYDMQSTAVAMVERQITTPATFTSLHPRRQGVDKARVENPGAL